jgi:hypothetical protein
VTGQSTAERHAGSLDVVADQLVVVAGQLPDALGDRPLGAFAQFVVAGLREAMGETTAAITTAVSTSDAMSAALRSTGTHPTPGGGQITELLGRLTVAGDAVRAGTWLSGDLGGDRTPPATDPLSGMDSAGLGWLTPFVAFLEAPLNQLRGNPGPVAAGALEFDRARQDVSAAAAVYRRATADANGRFVDALTALAESSGTIASALTGAGDVVARVARTVTGIVADVVGTVVPIMAAASATSGQSVAAAIPRCAGIAVEAGQRIAGLLAALLASGRNLLELVDGAVAVVRMVRQELTETAGENP